MDKLLELIENEKENLSSNSYNEILKEMMKIKGDNICKIDYLKTQIKNETLPTDENLLAFKVDTKAETRLCKDTNVDSFLKLGDNIDFIGGVKVSADIIGNLNSDIYVFQCHSCGEEVKIIIRSPNQIFINKEEYNN